MGDTTIEARVGMSLDDLSKLSRKQNVQKKKDIIASRAQAAKTRLKLKLKPKPKVKGKKPFAPGKKPKGVAGAAVSTAAAKKPAKFGAKHKLGPAVPGQGKPPAKHPGVKKKVSFKVGAAPSLFSKANKKKAKGGIMKPTVSSAQKPVKGAAKRKEKFANPKAKKLKQPALFSRSGAAPQHAGKLKRKLENVQFRVGGNRPAQGVGAAQLSRRQRKRKATTVLRFHADAETYEEPPVGGMVQVNHSQGHGQGQGGFLRHKSQHHQPTARRAPVNAIIPPDIEQCTVRIRNDLADGPSRSLAPGERLIQPTADDIEMRYPSPKRRRRVVVDGY